MRGWAVPIPQDPYDSKTLARNGLIAAARVRTCGSETMELCPPGIGQTVTPPAASGPQPWWISLKSKPVQCSGSWARKRTTRPSYVRG